MKKLAVIFLITGCVFAASSTASAATAVGRITYISSDGHRILVDNSDEYVLGPAVDVSKLNVAESVRVTYAEQNGQRTATAISPAPGS
jgi:hypothetical protein